MTFSSIGLAALWFKILNIFLLKRLSEIHVRFLAFEYSGGNSAIMVWIF